MGTRFSETIFYIGLVSFVLGILVRLYLSTYCKKRRRYFAHIDALTEQTRRLLYESRERSHEVYHSVHSGDFPAKSAAARALLEDIDKAEQYVTEMLEGEDSVELIEPAIKSSLKNIIRWSKEIDSLMVQSENCAAPL